MSRRSSRKLNKAMTSTSITSLASSTETEDLSLSNAGLNINVLDLIPVEEADFSDMLTKSFYSSLKYFFYNHITFICICFAVFFSLAFVYWLRVPNLAYSNNIELGNKIDINKLHKEIKEINEKLCALDKMIKNNSFESEVLNINSSLARAISVKIEEALNLYDADKLALMDYALESAGAFITSTPNTLPVLNSFSYDIFGIVNFQTPSNPHVMIQPGTLPGQCFAFKGKYGRIRIQLVHKINITAFTIEHAHMNLVLNRDSAPKDFKVYALESNSDVIGTELGTFTYKLNGKSLQTFEISTTDRAYQHVELNILTNYGNIDYTCVYRFRVHGIKP